MQMELFDYKSYNLVRLDEIFAAYYDCRQNKRKTFNALEFEGDYETKLIELWHEINEGTYYPGRSISFIVNKPVKREIFAADFRDRIVHHLVINKLMPLFEALFINDSYSCREGKGSQFGVSRISEFIRQCSENYTKDCYILKMDIQSFFMTIDKRILAKRLHSFLSEYYHAVDKKIILNLVEIIVYHCPQFNCIIKGKKSNWEGLPRSKSLFYAGKYRGLPIGNLSSQIFANFYMLSIADNVVQTDNGVIFTEQAISKSTKELVNFINHKTKSDDRIVIFPEGMMINFLTDRNGDDYYNSLIPLYVETFGEDKIIEHFKSDMPEYIVFNNQSMRDYYFQYICNDYALDFCGFINQNYTLEKVIDNEFRYMIFKRK